MPTRTSALPGTPASPPASKKSAGEFYTPQQISDILSGIVTLDCHEPETGQRGKLDKVLAFACGSGSLLLNIRKRREPTGRSRSSSARRRGAARLGFLSK